MSPIIPDQNPEPQTPPAPLSAERLAEIRELYRATTVTTPVTAAVPALLAEVERLQARLSAVEALVVESETADTAGIFTTDLRAALDGNAVLDTRTGGGR